MYCIIYSLYNKYIVIFSLFCSQTGTMTKLAYIFTIVSILSFVHLSVQINQACDPTQKQTVCPKNSFCNSGGWCECENGWVLGCDVPSKPLTQNDQQFQITETPSYFTIVPSSDEIIFVYRFYICTTLNTQRIALNLTLFADEGIQTTFNKQNQIGQIQIDSKNQCKPLFSPYMVFDIQQNGKIQQMVLKINTLPRANIFNLRIGDNQYNFQTTEPAKTTKMTIRVNQIYFIRVSTLWFIIIAFISLIFLSFIGGVVYCVVVLRNGRRFTNRFIDNNLQHFQKLLPKQKLSSTDDRIGHPCPVCLLQFQQKQQVRKTSCLHTFHHQCLDIWCKKNLTCPVCRNSLQKSDLQIKMSTITTNSSNSNIGRSNNVNNSQYKQLEQEIEEPTQLMEHRKKNIRERLIK